MRVSLAHCLLTVLELGPPQLCVQNFYWPWWYFSTRWRGLFNGAHVLLRHCTELEMKDITGLIKHPYVIPLTNIKVRSDKDLEATTK